MIFLLEDYATTMTAAALRAGYMESYPLNEEWRTVTVPMSDFPAAKDGIDLTNIKQMVIELQGAGNVMIDDFKIVPLEDVKENGGKPGVFVLNTQEGEAEAPCNRIIARLGGVPPRRFVERREHFHRSADSVGVRFLTITLQANTQKAAGLVFVSHHPQTRRVAIGNP